MAIDRRGPSGRRPVGRRVLVVCEGQVTEKEYFETLRSHLRLARANLLILPAGGGSPAAVVDRALAERDRYGANSAGAFDDAWVVLDAERADRSGIRDAVARAADAGLSVAVSNPCFEVWLLLHDAPIAAPLSATGAKRELESRLRIPGATGPATFDDPRLGGVWKLAATHARKRRGDVGSVEGLADRPSAQVVIAGNPLTDVDLLVAELITRRGRSQ